MKPLETQILTFQYRVMNRSAVRHLRKLSIAVNQVWNYSNQASFHMIQNHNKWLGKYDLNNLVSGSSKELGLHSQTVQGISEELVTRRIQFKKKKLSWRTSFGKRRSLGWIPFKKVGVKIEGSKVIYCGRELKFKKHREILGVLKSGSFAEDSKGNWYVNFAVEVSTIKTNHEFEDVGIDLGLKTAAALSNGEVIENSRVFEACEEKLASFQRHHKKKQARNLNAKIRNIRKDFIHKKTLEVVKKFKTIFVGDVSGKFLQSKNGKSSADASTGAIRSILSYKAIRHQGRVVDVSERSIASTITCSDCFERNGPSGLSGLRIREWECQCGAVHDRDVNAAINHLRVGRDSLRAAKAA